MSNEKKESRIKVEDLPQDEQELRPKKRRKSGRDRQHSGSDRQVRRQLSETRRA